METGTPICGTREVEVLCEETHELADSLTARSVHINPTGDGRFWVLVNLPGQTSLTLYIGPDREYAESLVRVAARVVKHSLQYIQTVAQLVSKEKLGKAAEEKAPRTYSVGVEACANDILFAVMSGEVFRA